MLPSHFFISDDGGSLHDTRIEGWSAKPIRTNYCRTHTRINSVEDVKATLRAGEFAFPGGYPMYFVMGDNEPVSFDSVRANFREVVDAIRNGGPHDGWRPVAVQINYEDVHLMCAISNAPIQAAYGSEETAA